MASACAWSVALVGLEGRMVEVEADIGAGLPRTVLVGLPDSALYQSRDRCKAAVSNSGQTWPISLLTINLSPATLPKAGSHYDLAIVAAVLAADHVFPAAELRRTALLGELGLDGRVRPVRGVLPATLAAAQAGFTRVVVPLRQAGEAKLVDGVEVFGVGSISQLVALFRGEPMPEVEPIEVIADRAGGHADRQLDLADVVGQVEAKWACEVAAAGRHHMLFHGPPGVGKTMLAERVPSLLPDLDLHEALAGLGRALAGRLPPRRSAGHPAALQRPAPLSQHGQHGRRRAAAGQAGSDLLRPQGGALPRRSPGVRPEGDRRVAYAVGVRHGAALPQRGRGPLSGAVPVDLGRQPLPVRAGRRPRARTASARRWSSAGTPRRSPGRSGTGSTSPRASCRCASPT